VRSEQDVRSSASCLSYLPVPDMQDHQQDHRQRDCCQHTQRNAIGQRRLMFFEGTAFVVRAKGAGIDHHRHHRGIAQSADQERNGNNRDAGEHALYIARPVAQVVPPGYRPPSFRPSTATMSDSPALGAASRVEVWLTECVI
jgi:hypothetical protein